MEYTRAFYIINTTHPMEFLLLHECGPIVFIFLVFYVYRYIHFMKCFILCNFCFMCGVTDAFSVWGNFDGGVRETGEYLDM